MRRPVSAWVTLLLLAGLAGGDEATVRSRELVRETFTLDHLSSDWEILLPDAERVLVTAGRLRVETTPARDWLALHRIRNLVRYRFPLAGSQLSARTDVEIAIDTAGHGAALVLYQDDQNWVELALVGEGAGDALGRVFRLTRRVRGENATAVRAFRRGPAEAPDRVTLVLEREGDVFRGLMEVPFGPPGVVRRGVVGELLAPGLGDLQLILKTARLDEPRSDAPPMHFDDVVAVGFSEDAALRDPPAAMHVEYATDFRDVERFRRDFTVMRPELHSLALEDGLELVARYGIPGDRWTPLRNLVVLNRPLPKGHYELEVELDAAFTSPHDDVGVVLYGEKGNALYLGHWAIPGKEDEGRRAYVRTVTAGAGETRFSPDPATHTDVEATTLVFRLERDAAGYAAWVDVGGRGWVRLGEAQLKLMEPRLGLFARSARDRGELPGAGVRFARLWVMTPRTGR